ncbi:MAG: hypothetical protein CL607_21190 [Anaerolineaceae bacterium]|nr:hypothetical protein [Anaerolineaceae bacterium]
MPTYPKPDVYFEWYDSHPHILTPRRTDIAGFVGIAARGPLHEAHKIASWTQYVSLYGEPTPQGYLGYAVRGFFANGGAECWVVRVADPNMAQTAGIRIQDVATNRQWQLEAASPGSWANDLIVTMQRVNEDRFNLSLQLRDGTQEGWSLLSLNPADERYIATVFEHGDSQSFLVQMAESTPNYLMGTMSLDDEWHINAGAMRGGCDGLATMGATHISGDGAPINVRWGLRALEVIDEVSIIAIPDIMPKPEYVPPRKKERDIPCSVIELPEDYVELLPPSPPEFAYPFSDDEIEALQQAMIRHCEQLKDRFAILDVRPNDTVPQAVINWRLKYDTRYAALYFPWLTVNCPVCDNDNFNVPPSGHAAGVYANTDLTVGVHQAPANVDMEDVKDVVMVLDDTSHVLLREKRINSIRAVPAGGIRLIDSFTLSSDSLWRYINVRRLITMIAEAIDEQTQWTVFEPNDLNLASEITRIIRQFLGGLWERRMLSGATSGDAFTVRCDETTTQPHDIDAGRLICEVGLLPPWPAEFVIVRIGRQEGRTELIEG